MENTLPGEQLKSARRNQFSTVIKAVLVNLQYTG